MDKLGSTASTIICRLAPLLSTHHTGDAAIGGSLVQRNVHKITKGNGVIPNTEAGKMAAATQLASLLPAKSPQFSSVRNPSSSLKLRGHLGFRQASQPVRLHRKRASTVVCAFGDVSADSTNYLIAGAVAVALIGTAFPILFSRKDLCPECDGAGFVRKAGSALRANAARKDQSQIVCPRCNGLGKLGQIDK